MGCIVISKTNTLESFKTLNSPQNVPNKLMARHKKTQKTITIRLKMKTIYEVTPSLEFSDSLVA
jgi:hypothetical protein